MAALRAPAIRRPRHRLTPLICALVVALMGVTPATAHEPTLTTDADHLYAAEQGANPAGPGLFARLPDERTAMASTTKVMTLQIALATVKATLATYDDQVDITPTAATQPRTNLVDDAGAEITSLETMTLEHLLYGMMVRSANDATWAVAEHIAKKRFGPAGTVAQFVDLMNARAQALGLTQTFYQNPVGYDHVTHWTSARDLARLWLVGLQDPEFVRFVRPIPNTSPVAAIGYLPGGATKTYTLAKGVAAPGADGHKNGLSNGCNGFPAVTDENGNSLYTYECFVASARRIGRRVVVAMMQSSATPDRTSVFDAAFQKVFHPEHRAKGAVGAAADAMALACPATGRAVTATIRAGERTRMTTWRTNVTSAAVSVAGTRQAPTGSLTASPKVSRDVEMVALSASHVVTATRSGTAVELRLWSLSTAGAIGTVGAPVGTRDIGAAATIELVRLSSTLFATVARSSGGGLAIRTWRRTSNGLTLLGKQTATSTDLLEVDAVAASTSSTLRLVTVSRRSAPLRLVVSTWDVNATTGAISLRDSTVPAFYGDRIATALLPVETQPGEGVPDRYIAVASRSDSQLRLTSVRIRANGVVAPDKVVVAGGDYAQVELAGFGPSGLVSLVRWASGRIEPMVWWSRRDAAGSLTPTRVASHLTSVVAPDPELCITPTSAAAADLVTAAREGTTPSQRIRLWRIAPKPAP